MIGKTSMMQMLTYDETEAWYIVGKNSKNKQYLCPAKVIKWGKKGERVVWGEVMIN